MIFGKKYTTHESNAEDKASKPRFDWRHMESWQKRRLFGSIAAIIAIFGLFLALTCSQLYADRAGEDFYWDKYLNENPEMQETVEQYSQDATEVLVGTYLENIRAVDIKNSQFEVEMNVWYRWEDNDKIDFSGKDTVHFYKGQVKSSSVIDNYHEGAVHYQQIRYDVVVNKQFWTPRFPLESHQLRIYLEPSENVNDVYFVVDEENSYTNPSLGISGFRLMRFDVAQNIVEYDKTNSNPEYAAFEDGKTYKSELMAQAEISREDFGLYIKCFIAMYGTTAWILLCLYICTFRRVDPLGMIGSAFFGAVSNIMIGANLVPDALKLGLLEYGNLFGVGVIIAGTAVVIGINAIRKEHENHAFAEFYGRIMLALFVVVVVVGNIALPLSAWLH